MRCLYNETVELNIPPGHNHAKSDRATDPVIAENTNMLRGRRSAHYTAPLEVYEAVFRKFFRNDIIKLFEWFSGLLNAILADSTGHFRETRAAGVSVYRRRVPLLIKSYASLFAARRQNGR